MLLLADNLLLTFLRVEVAILLPKLLFAPKGVPVVLVSGVPRSLISAENAETSEAEAVDGALDVSRGGTTTAIFRRGATRISSSRSSSSLSELFLTSWRRGIAETGSSQR